MAAARVHGRSSGVEIKTKGSGYGPVPSKATGNPSPLAFAYHILYVARFTYLKKKRALMLRRGPGRLLRLASPVRPGSGQLDPLPDLPGTPAGKQARAFDLDGRQ